MFASNKKNTFRNNPLVTALLVVALVLAPFITSGAAHAAALTQTLVRFDRMKISTATTGTVCFKPTTSSASASVVVTFPTGYTLGAAGTFTVDSTTTSWPSGGTAITGIATANSVSSQAVTFPFTSATLSTSTLYCFNWNSSSAVTTKSTATTNNLGTVALSNGDTSGYGTATIADDQIAVSATVPSVFSFALSGNSDALGTLSTSTVSVGGTPRTATVSTNAANGWSVWARDAYQGLCAPSLGTCTVGTPSTQFPASTAGTNGTLTAGTVGYNTGIVATSVAAGAAVTPNANYIGTATGQGGGLDATLRTVASAAAPSDTAVMTIKNNASINGIVKPATDYADTITVVAAGLF